MQKLTKILFTICFFCLVVFVVALFFYIQSMQQTERIYKAMASGDINEQLNALPPEQRDEILNKYPALRG